MKKVQIGMEYMIFLISGILLCFIIDFGNKLNLRNAIIVVGNKDFSNNNQYSNLVVNYHQGFDFQEKYYMGKYI